MWRNNYNHWKITCEEIHIWMFNSNISEFELLILCSFQFQYFWIWIFNPNIPEFDQPSSVFIHIKPAQTSSTIFDQPSSVLCIVLSHIKVDQTSIYQPSSVFMCFCILCSPISNPHLSTFQRVSVFLHIVLSHIKPAFIRSSMPFTFPPIFNSNIQCSDRKPSQMKIWTNASHICSSMQPANVLQFNAVNRCRGVNTNIYTNANIYISIPIYMCVNTNIYLTLNTYQARPQRMYDQ